MSQRIKILNTAGTARNIFRGNGKSSRIPPLWDGHAAERIVEILRRVLA
jgi:hypothetical protein